MEGDSTILNSTRIWYEDMVYNARRLAKLLLRGNHRQVISPSGIDGENTLQKLVNFNNKVLTSLLRDALNTTIHELATAAHNSPKQFLKNAICFTPNVMRLLRSKNEPEDRRRLKRPITKLRRTLGKY